MLTLYFFLPPVDGRTDFPDVSPYASPTPKDLTIGRASQIQAQRLSAAAYQCNYFQVPWN